MAKGGNKEHRMVFDVRGKRRGVVKVVYAILAVLMGLSLFLLGAGGSLSSLLGSGGSSSTSATKLYVEQAENIERKLVKSPEDADLLANLTRTRVNAGNAAVAQTATGVQQTLESQQEYNKASAAWSEYLKATEEPNSGLAQLMSNTLYTLATISSGAEIELNIKAAAEAQAIVAKNQPSLGSKSTLALYLLYTFDYAGAEKVKKEAIALTESKPQREQFENKYEEIEKNARKLQKQLRETAKAEKEGAKANPETTENPLGGGTLGE